ncbi:helix-turn-helix domain-containing protein, partial [Defluviimonas salinarum]
MEVIRGHVYRLKPTPEQDALMARTAGVTRLVYNLALEQRRTWGGRRYGGGRSRTFGAKGLSGELSELRRTFDWIGAVSQTAQNQALIDLDRAFANFFEGRAGYPKPRRKGRDDAFRQVGREIAVRRLNAKWSEVKILKIGWVRYRDTRPLRPRADGAVEIRNATIRRRAGGGWEI